ncbi:hypothetical protein DAPPUDRAFT_319673 [Daphnia pulex]|uniref:Ionotropic glutamate receptor C-terminal domain-containing protein n=1 Tax=Daphnia pulex TaxID=6669 RepID=E9GMG4_DAPPU|nr:hypothetical protein DAPPUDRAFT_319673 [Daphnia pulex]|eukprot:EFX79396.1 hypothetical protein DAPPUDRAFT_319673 [Daphnia pulex]
MAIGNTTSDDDLRGSLQQGKELRVVTGHFELINVRHHHHVSVSALRFHLAEFIWSNYGIFKPHVSTVTLLVSEVEIHEADLGLVPVTVSLERYEAIEFSGFVRGDNTGILVKYPAANISFTSAFDVFSIGIWIGGISSGIAIAAVSVILSYVAKRLRMTERPVMSAGSFLWHLYGATISQGNHFPCRQPSQKLLVATWCFVTFVFVNTYNSTLTSYMSVTYQRPEINSFRDLATATPYKATVLIGSIQDIDLRRSQNGDLKMIADRVKKCSLDCRKFSFEELAVSVLEEENCVSIIPFSAGVALLRKYNAKSCRLAMAFESTSWKPMYLAVPKSSPYKEEINRASLWFYDTGLREHWFEVYEKPAPGQCRLDYNSKGVATKRSSNKIQLEHLQLPFLILFGGYLLAFIQFFREKCMCPLR